MKLILTTVENNQQAKVIAHAEELLMTNQVLNDSRTVYEIGTRVAEYANRTKLVHLDSSSGDGILFLWRHLKGVEKTPEDFDQSVRSFDTAVDLLTSIFRQQFTPRPDAQKDVDCLIEYNNVKLLVEIKNINITVDTQSFEEPDKAIRGMAKPYTKMHYPSCQNIAFGFKE